MNRAKELFNLAYRESFIQPFKSLLSIEGGGIPQRVKFFSSFDPQNTIYNDVKFTKNRSASLVECMHMCDYLACEELREAAKSRKYDAVVNAIVSFALEWDRESRRDFGMFAPRYERFMQTIDAFAHYENGAYVYGFEFEGRTIAYCKCAFKLMKSLLVEPQMMPENETFHLMHHISSPFIDHLHKLYNNLMNETLTYQDILELEKPMPIPFDIQSQIGDYAKLKETAKVKFITGQACSGKTTLLQYLNQIGNWQIMSRGKIGGFSGKADNPVAVAALHASTEFVLRHSNVLGDRSNIDNPLWVGIMELCDPKYTKSLVWELLRFLNANLNAASIGYYINQRGVVFIDPYPSLCEKRMLNRGTGGDIYRSRIIRYAVVQAMAYYTIARLFGWKIYCVPYTENREFNPAAYKEIASELLTDQHFGVATLENPIPVVCYHRPPNNRPIDNTYPKATGIYK